MNTRENVPNTFSSPSTISIGVARKYAPDIRDYIAHLAHHGIDAFEIGFAFGIPQRLDKDILHVARRANVALSCHLPFWINLGNEKRDKNVEYLVQGLRIAHQIESVAVFHLGFYGGQPFEQLLPAIISILHEVADKAGMGAGRLGIETTGKQKALGTIDEVLAIVAAVEDERFMPVIDWAHLYARANGSCPTSRQHVRDILRKCDDACPGISYFHGGGIEFSNGNELRHVSARITGPDIPMILDVVRGQSHGDFTFIVESPDSLEDVHWLRTVSNEQSCQGRL